MKCHMGNGLRDCTVKASEVHCWLAASRLAIKGHLKKPKKSKYHLYISVDVSYPTLARDVACATRTMHWTLLRWRMHVGSTPIGVTKELACMWLPLSALV